MDPQPLATDPSIVSEILERSLTQSGKSIVELSESGRVLVVFHLYFQSTPSLISALLLNHGERVIAL